MSNKSEECSAQVGDLLAAWLGVYSLLFPLFIYVLFVGYRQCTSKTSAPSNLDIFTLNIIGMEILNILGTCFYCAGLHTDNPLILNIGENIFFVATVGQIAFHDLTCVERYLAVVHPIQYLHLKNSAGVKIRNISIGCTWVVSVFLVTAIYVLAGGFSQLIFMMTLTIVSILVVCFCTASVLSALIRPRLGEVGGDRRALRALCTNCALQINLPCLALPLDQSKRMAFYTIMVALVALSTRFTIILSSYGIVFLPNLEQETKCLISIAAYWFSLPSSLILPLLFLRRAGKLPKCK